MKEYSVVLNRLREIQELNISSNFFLALVAAEDHRYWQHNGIDLRSIIRALYCTFLKNKLEGASTIEQQLIRTLTCRYEITLNRKLHEMIMALALAISFKKEQILSCYLLCGNYGWEMDGLMNACRKLDISLETATLIEAANVVARLKRPEPKIRSRNHKYNITKRSEYILQRVNRYSLTIPPSTFPL